MLAKPQHAFDLGLVGYAQLAQANQYAKEASVLARNATYLLAAKARDAMEVSIWLDQSVFAVMTLRRCPRRDMPPRNLFVVMPSLCCCAGRCEQRKRSKPLRRSV